MNNLELKVVSWNMNGGVLAKLPLVEQLVQEYDVVCLQEHFLTTEGLQLLEVNDSSSVFSVPAKRSGRGRPSGGISILVRRSLNPSLYKQSDFFVGVRIADTALFCVYMPTDYRDDESDARFNVACGQICGAVDGCVTQKLSCIVTGDMNCNLCDNSPRTQVLVAACESLRVLENDLDYTYVHNSGSVSSLDSMLCSADVKTNGKCRVKLSICASDHLPISNVFCVTNKPTQPDECHRKWVVKSEWGKADSALFKSVYDNILEKIKVPFQLLQQGSPVPDNEKQILLNNYCAEITHALRCAEKAAVPTRKVRIGSENPQWSQNVQLSESCSRSKFWYTLWNECGRPRQGVLNDIRLYTKRKFAKTLAKHRTDLMDQNCKVLEGDPNAVWKYIKKKRSPKSRKEEILPSESDWNKYFTDEFSPPNKALEEEFEKELDSLLASNERSVGFVVTVSSIRHMLSKLKKKYSRGDDNICGMHLAIGGDSVLNHLALMYQMIFTCGLVPDVFCVGVVTPVPKKGNDPRNCSSYRPITVAPVFCKLMEMLVFGDLSEACYTPDSQFGFKSGTSREHVHSLIANLLLSAHDNNDTLVLASHDVRRAFDSGIHAHILSSACKRGVDRSVVVVWRSMYRRLRVKIKVPTHRGMVVSTVVIPVRKGIRQGSITSPPLYNNSIIVPQESAKTCCIYLGIDVSLINYADDILNASRSVSRVEDNYNILSDEYAKIGLAFNTAKSEVVVFRRNAKDSTPISVLLGDTAVSSKPSLTYLGLPIASDLRSTREALVEHFSEKARKAYGLLLPCKRMYNRHILGRLYSVFVIPHVLSLSPFWSLFTETDKRSVRRVYYKYAKYLLSVPPWERNSRVSKNYSVVDPTTAATERIVRFRRSLNPDHDMYRAIVG